MTQIYSDLNQYERYSSSQSQIIVFIDKFESILLNQIP